MTIQNIEETVAALRVQLAEVKTKLDNLIISLNGNTVSKSQLDAVKVELIQLKDALERGDFVNDDGVQSTLDTLENQITIATQAKDLFEDLKTEVTNLRDEIEAVQTAQTQIRGSLATLTLKIDQHLLDS